MQIVKTEIRTGLLVVVSLAILVGVLLYLGAPGVFTKMNTYRVFFDNAAGMNQGAQVLLAGRKVGQVVQLYSPVPAENRPREFPKAETIIEVRVERRAKIYRQVRVHMQQNGLLGQMVIDFTNGDEQSGLAPEGSYFIGERAGDLSEAVPTVIEKLEPVILEATKTMQSLQETAVNLGKITSEGSDFTLALAQFRVLGTNLATLSNDEGELRKTLKNVEALTGPKGHLHQSLENLDKLTTDLKENKDINLTLQNFRTASEKLNKTMSELGPKFSTIGTNIEQFSDTVKREPWRLIWKQQKQYPEEALRNAAPPQQEERAPRAKPTSRRSRR